MGDATINLYEELDLTEIPSKMNTKVLSQTLDLNDFVRKSSGKKCSELLSFLTDKQYENYSSGADNSVDIQDIWWRAQTFTTGSSQHSMTAIKIKLWRGSGNPGNTFTVGIRATDGDGHPTGSDLTGGTLNSNNLTTSTLGTWYTIPVEEYMLAAATKYAIVARADGTLPLGSTIHWLSDSSSPTYTDGNLEVSNNSGNTWSTTLSVDLMFEIWDLETDRVLKTFTKIEREMTSLIHESYFYKCKKHQTFEVIIYRNGSSLDLLKENIIEFEFTKSLSDEVGGGYILFENADQLDYREGDQIEIKWQSEGEAIPTRVFTGEIDKAEREWNEEKTQQNLRISFQDWGKLLLERKITRAYDTVEDVNTIIEEILADITTTNNPPYIHERKINLSEVEDLSYKTRTIDFVGESLFDCLKKLAFITQCEFYVDKNKRLQFFSRPIAGPEVMTIEISDIMDYGYESRDDLLMNTIQVYGHQNKPIPLDCDSWTEGTLSWSTIYVGSALSAVDIPAPKMGNYSIKIPVSNTLGPTTWYEWYQNEGWCTVGPGSKVFNLCICCPEGKSIYFNGSAVYHEGYGNVQMQYAWGTPDYFINNGAPVSGQFGWRYGTWGESSYQAGGIDQNLYVRWTLGNIPLYFTGCMANFYVHYKYSGAPTEEKFGARLTIPSDTTIDLTLENGPVELIFFLFSNIANYSFSEDYPAPKFEVRITFENGEQGIYRAEHHIYPSGWSEVRIAIGRAAENEAWTGTTQEIVKFIELDLTIPVSVFDADDYLLIDAFRFDSAKWYGVYSDSNSMQSPPDGYGIKYKKLFDDTLYSDTAAQRWALEHVLRFKTPLYFLNDVDTVVNGIEDLEPGDIVKIEIPETSGRAYFYRAIEMRFKYSEEEALNSLLYFERTDDYE